jgi:seryl-tRNA(Sec) selenium transferase
MLHRTSHSDEVLLVGTERALNRFEVLAPRNSEIALLTVVKQRIKIIAAEQTTKVRDDLMRKAWHPERFGEIPQRALPQPVAQ